MHDKGNSYLPPPGPARKPGTERKSQYHHRKTSLVVIDDEEQKINSPAFWFKQIRVLFACNQIFWKLFRNKDRTRPWTVMEWMVEGIMEIPFIQLSISYWDHWNVQSFCAVIFRPNPSPTPYPGGVCWSARHSTRTSCECGRPPIYSNIHFIICHDWKHFRSSSYTA